jgi:hypothetical protein
VGTAVGSGATEAAQARFARDVTNDVNYRIRAALSWDVRQETEFGSLRTYVRFGAQDSSPANTGSGTTFTPFWNRAFMQFAGFTVGRSQSFFDLFAYDGAYSYHTVPVQGDTSATSINLWAYSAAFGSGVSGTLSLEDPGGHNRAATVDAYAASFGVNAAVAGDTAFADQNSTLNGFRLPDVVANLRVDQAWGFAGISGALHDASGAYYGAANNVANGHPADKLGWAFAVGGKLNLPGDDMIGAACAGYPYRGPHPCRSRFLQVEAATAAIRVSASTKSAHARSGIPHHNSMWASNCSTRTSTAHTRVLGSIQPTRRGPLSP